MGRKVSFREMLNTYVKVSLQHYLPILSDKIKLMTLKGQICNVIVLEMFMQMAYDAIVVHT